MTISKTVPPLIFSLGALACFASAFALAFAPGDPAAQSEYRNDKHHYALLVPDDLIVTELEASGMQTVMFTDASGDKEFQISAVPYTELDLTLDRYQQPSGASDQPDHLEIVNVVRGDLLSVGFRKNGVSFLVVTLPEFEAWLTDILRTWQFI